MKSRWPYCVTLISNSCQHKMRCLLFDQTILRFLYFSVIISFQKPRGFLVKLMIKLPLMDTGQNKIQQKLIDK